MTGVAVSTLFESAEALERRPELVEALPAPVHDRVPRPQADRWRQRGFGVVPTFTAREACPRRRGR